MSDHKTPHQTFKRRCLRRSGDMTAYGADKPIHPWVGPLPQLLPNTSKRKVGRIEPPYLAIRKLKRTTSVSRPVVAAGVRERDLFASFHNDKVA
jgi:hypothetical protein